MRYRQGWQALNRLLHEDRSFSGQEKHCAYLNTGKGRFTDVSAITGLHFPEDGRALGTVDWDFDGDLDLWISNRTAPRVRFLRNSINTENCFLSLHLVGKGGRSNRDAIGARVEIKTNKPLVQSKRAGEGFLTQSSGWLHFGLGQWEDPVEVKVQWPDGLSEIFADVAPNQFYVLRQQSGQAEPWTPPVNSSAFASKPTTLTLPEPESEARIILPDGLAVPELHSLPNGKVIDLGSRPVLINVWASWCQPCREELAAWASGANTFLKAGISVIALNADEDEKGRTQAAKLVKKLSAPFTFADASHGSLRALDLLQRSVLDRWDPMPVPSSFLVDSRGYLIAIYKGPVSADTVVKDLTLAKLSAEQRRAASTPFQGIWTHDPSVSDPMRLCTQFVDHDLVDEGLTYLQHATRLDQKWRAERIAPSTLADRHYVMATILRAQSKPEQAMASYRNAHTLNPQDVRVAADWGELLLGSKKYQEAIQPMQAAIKLAPEDQGLRRKLAMTLMRTRQPAAAVPHFKHLVKSQPRHSGMAFYHGLALQQADRVEEALAAFESALRIDPKNWAAANNLAWIYAAHPNESIRRPKRALQIATSLSSAYKDANPTYLSTLAVAQAANAQFPEAITTLNRALKVGGSQDPKWSAALTKRRLLFENKQPFRDATLLGKPSRSR